jgi:chromosome segregation ATPase
VKNGSNRTKSRSPPRGNAKSKAGATSSTGNKPPSADSKHSSPPSARSTTSAGDTDTNNNTEYGGAESSSDSSDPNVRAIGVLNTTIAALRVQLNTAKRDAELAHETGASLRHELTERESSIQSLAVKVDSLKSALASVHTSHANQLERAHAQIATIQESLRTEAEWNAMTQSVTAGRAAVKAAKEELARKTKVLTATKELLTKTESTVAELNAALEAKDAKLTKTNNLLVCL